jgi:threonine dehydrogenase-like Zn-dependent dehydrogenase
MKGLTLSDGQLRLRDDLPLPTCPSGEALVRVERAGICKTDLELVKGYYPFDGVLGHEFVGTVEEGPPDFVGQRVVGEINAVCGRCSACRQARPTHCQDRTVLGIVNRDGAFAEYLSLPVENLLPVPDAIGLDEATFTEPLAAALQVLEQIHIRPTDHVLVIGDGRLGLLIAQVMAMTGCALLVQGRHQRKLDIVAARGIATTRDTDYDAGAFDVAVECTGSPEGFTDARRAVRAQGTIVMKSTYAGDLTLDASALVVDEITLMGSRCGPFAPALQLLEQQRVDVTSLIEARYPINEAPAAMAHAERKGVLKVLLDF